MASKPESRLQRKIQKALKLRFKGSFWIKIWTGPFQVAGFPDLLGCVDGLFFAFEVKRPGEEAEPHQLSVMRKIRKAGGVTGVIYEPKEALTAVLEALATSKKGSRFLSKK